jgi:hypothetical protein
MYDPRYCSCYKCNNYIGEGWSALFGVCPAHLMLLLDTHYYIGICWNCGSISYIGDRVYVIRDKYIFSRGCKVCGNEDLSIQWMTLNEQSSRQLSRYAVDHNGVIVVSPIITNTNIR